MKKKAILTTQIYRKYNDTDRYMVEVALDSYEEIFNEWDPAPFKRRDVHPALVAFFEECSSEISLRHPLAIAFYLPKRELDSETQERCASGLRNYFAFSVHVLYKQLARSHKHTLRNAAIGGIFLFIATFFDKAFEHSVLPSVFGQGLFIGGWVFVWEALSTFAFKDNSIRYKIKEWERFLDAPIVFKKEKKPDQSLS